jgi:methionyl-tRNA formyltransferase
MAGDSETGITYQFIEKKLDSGDIICMEKIKIQDSDDAITMHDKLSRLAADTVLGVLDMVESGKAKRIKQNEAGATYVSVLKKENGKIDFSDSSMNIFNKIRALIPWPVAFCSLDATILKIWKSEIYSVDENISTRPPGTIVCLVKNKGFAVKTGDGCILITEMQEQSGKKMPAWDYCVGHKGIKGKVLC